MIRELKTLIAVAREGTFAAAGLKVNLTQAAVSAQMQRLEAELGYEIFERKGRNAQLNRRGQQILAQAQEVIRLYNSLGSSALGAAPTVQVEVGAIASVQRTLLPQALAQFHGARPECRTRIIPGLSLELLSAVDAREIDIAVIIRPPFELQSDLHWTTLASEPYRLIVPAGLADGEWTEMLSTQPFIRYDRSSFGGRQVDRFLQNLISTPKTCVNWTSWMQSPGGGEGCWSGIGATNRHPKCLACVRACPRSWRPHISSRYRPGLPGKRCLERAGCAFDPADHRGGCSAGLKDCVTFANRGHSP